jgi:hypothetical protein
MSHFSKGLPRLQLWPDEEILLEKCAYLVEADRLGEKPKNGEESSF